MSVVELDDAVAVLGQFPALAGATLRVEEGEIVLLRGPNGAGKTTLLRLCAGLLPHVVEVNLKALQSRAPESPAINRYTEVARIITGRPADRASEGINWIQELCSQLQVPRLAEYGIKETDFSAIIANSRNASSMKGNPVDLTSEELKEVFERAV